MKNPGHVPVLLEEVVSFVRDLSPRVVLDGTVGLGGHARGILRACDSVERYVGLDVDDAALSLAWNVLQGFEGRCQLFRASYEQAPSVLSDLGGLVPDVVLLDLGLSSFQLGCPERGFSYSSSGPLDMRMDPGLGITAYDILKRSSARRLQEIFSRYGEFRFSRTLARALAALPEPPADTAQLRRLIHSVLPSGYLRKRRKDPAAQVFQALRIAVNDELGVIERALPLLFDVLACGGLFLAISFHSLEDRLVKNFLRSKTGRCTCPPDFPRCVCNAEKTAEILTRRPITAQPAEVDANPSSRSAKLRVARKI